MLHKGAIAALLFLALLAGVQIYFKDFTLMEIGTALLLCGLVVFLGRR